MEPSPSTHFEMVNIGGKAIKNKIYWWQLARTIFGKGQALLHVETMCLGVLQGALLSFAIVQLS